MTVSNSHLILVVDDEVSITKSLNRLFRKEGIKIIEANSGFEGLEILKNLEKPVSGIISDQRMPQMTGAQFLQQAKEIVPDAFRILLTGYSDINAIIEAVNKGEIQKYFTKPWNDDDLVMQVRQSLKQYELILENKRLNKIITRQNKELKDINQTLEQKVEERSKQIKKKNIELEHNLYNTVRAFASLIDSSSPAIAGHGRRVSLFSKQIGQNLKLSDTEVTNIEIAALLHDIGKIGYPEKLLTVNYLKLNEKEKELYERHPEEGQQIVRFINKLDHVGLIIRSHHERYDGMGYPDHLSEDSIPVESQIISVSDRYDSIVNLKINADNHVKEYATDRNITYDHIPTDTLLKAAAIFHIKKNAFTEFSPDVVKAFLSYIEKQGIHDGRDKEISLEEISEGMTLSRSLYTLNGRFILPYNTKLTKELIDKLKILHSKHSMVDKIYVLV